MAGPKKPDPANIAKNLLSKHDLELVSYTTLQTLWAGYGNINAIIARATTDEAATHLSKLCDLEPRGAGSTYPLILKLISPPPSQDDEEDEGHLRKMLSYEVEQYFYSDAVPLLGNEVSVAKLVASTRGDDEFAGSELMATIMVDLRPAFPVTGGKRSTLDSVQVHAALEWLAGFHRRSWPLISGSLEKYILPPFEESARRKAGGGGKGLWLNGGYTYLSTRWSEYTTLADDTDSEWSGALCRVISRDPPHSLAMAVALFLTPCGRDMESYIHGDVKSENLFTTRDGARVAFFDFQYVGLGLGVCDLAKLFTCSVPMHMLDETGEALPEKLAMCEGEKRLLQRYHTSLVQNKGPAFYPWEEFTRHWEAALVDWCRFQASWGFWGNTEWLEARVRSIVDDHEWRDWLRQNVKNEDFRKLGTWQL